MSGSQFASLFKTDSKEKKEAPLKNRSAKKKPTASPPPKNAQAQPDAKPQKRVTGKSSNADYTQVLSYVKKDTHNRVKAALIFDDQQRDLSDLVEELLGEWLKSKK